MEQQAVDPWLAVLEISVLFGSVAIWLHFVSVWRRGETVLAYEARQQVPWGPVAVLPALFFVLLALWPSAAGDIQSSPKTPESASQAAQQLLAAMLFQLVVTAAVFGIAVISEATARDFGVQPGSGRLSRDVGIGLAACVAAAAPVYGIQGLLLYLLQREDPSRHPLIEMVTDGQPNVGVLLLAGVAAVVVAPICEEVTYRLVLQGWLEKWEDERLGWRDESLRCAAPMANDESSLTNEAPTTDDDSATAAIDPPRRGAAGLPYGGFPIFVSSTLFALAHFGYGPEPLPIFLLALILGYVYQRTHRIIPCIVAHALFNLLTMLVLWRMVFHAPDQPL